jgi:hypothetical protein
VRLTDDIFFEQNSESIDMIFYGSNWSNGEGQQNGAPAAGLSAFFKMSLKLDSEVQAREVKAKKDKRKTKKNVTAELQDQVEVLKTQAQVGVSDQKDQVGVSGQKDQVGVSGQKDQVGVSGQKDQVGVSGQKDQVGVSEPQGEIDRKQPGPAFHPIVRFLFLSKILD